MVIEQVDGLRTHHPAAYMRFREALDSLPYIWYHRPIEAHFAFGATHLRNRLLWVGVRIDCHLTPSEARP